MEESARRWNICGVEVLAEGFPDMSEEETRKYLAYVMDKVPDPILSLKISPEKDGKVGLRYASRTVKFERIRRITGYLVGTTDRWNNAKKTEECERVKHDTE